MLNKLTFKHALT